MRWLFLCPTSSFLLFFFEPKKRKKDDYITSGGMQRCKGGGGTEPFIYPCSFVRPELTFAFLFVLLILPNRSRRHLWGGGRGYGGQILKGLTSSFAIGNWEGKRLFKKFRKCVRSWDFLMCRLCAMAWVGERRTAWLLYIISAITDSRQHFFYTAESRLFYSCYYVSIAWGFIFWRRFLFAGRAAFCFFLLNRLKSDFQLKEKTMCCLWVGQKL